MIRKEEEDVETHPMIADQYVCQGSHTHQALSHLCLKCDQRLTFIEHVNIRSSADDVNVTETEMVQTVTG